MNAKPDFHGSDLEEISEYYRIPKESIVSFGANVNPLGLSPKVREQLSKNLDVISSYPDREYTSLRDVIGKYCRTSPDCIMVGSGSTELISLLIGRRRPEKTLILGPTYSEYERELSFSGSRKEYFHLNPETGFKLDMAAFLDRLERGYDLLVLCNPNNPTSSVITLPDMEQIIKTAGEHGTFVMIDETYAEFAADVSTVTAMPLVSEYDNFMVLRGVSKFFAAPGLRLGYAVTGNRPFLAQLKEQQIPWSLNSVGAFAGELLLTDTDYIKKTRSLVLSERTRLLERLCRLKSVTVYDAEANFILLKILKKNISASDVFDVCIKKGMMIRDCSSFQCLKGEYVRFCIMMPQDNTRLMETFEEILQ